MSERIELLKTCATKSDVPIASIVLAAAFVFVLMVSTQVMAQCDPSEVQKVNSSDGDFNDDFGDAVAIDDNVAVVGAKLDDDFGTDSGSASIYRFDGTNWVEEQKLLPRDGSAGTWFGSAVAIGDDKAVVGAWRDDAAGDDAGAVYIFRFDGTTWIEEQKLVTADLKAGDGFGFSVSISGRLILIGAPYDDEPNSQSGAAYVFWYDGSKWVEYQKIIPSEVQPSDEFGLSVSIQNPVAAIGTARDRAFVFRFDGSTWNEDAKLIPSDLGSNDGFGRAVSITGNVAFVGSPWNDEIATNAGAAYVFRYLGTGWVEEQKLTATDGAEEDAFGGAVDNNRNSAVIGAKDSDDAGEDSGSVYFYRYAYGTAQWTEERKAFASDARAFDKFGDAVSLFRGRAIIGAPNARGMMGDSGAGYAFDLNCIHDECLQLDVDRFVGGKRSQFTVTGGTPGERVVVYYGYRGQPTMHFDLKGWCFTFDFRIYVKGNRVRVLSKGRFDNAGRHEFGVRIPNEPGLRVFFQAAEHGTCPDECVSNRVDGVVQ